ncbi:integrase, catalytic region, zinc finger, CCHC-type containing protein [Tanacetum coccineum]
MMNKGFLNRSSKASKVGDNDLIGKGSLLGDLASKIRNIDGKILGRDGKPMMARRCVRFADVTKESICGDERCGVNSSSLVKTSSQDVTHPSSFDQQVCTVNMDEDRPDLGRNCTMEAIDEINARFVNTLYGFPVGKRLAFPMVLEGVCVVWLEMEQQGDDVASWWPWNVFEVLVSCYGDVMEVLGFWKIKWGNILITRVYFVKGFEHNLFLVGQFCDSDLEVAFRRNTCFVRNLEGAYLLKGNRTTNHYTINLPEMASASLICLMARVTSTKSWLWHQRLSHLNFDTINDLAKNDLVTGLPKFKYHKEHLCPSCEQGKSKRASHQPKPVPNSKQRLHLRHMDLCDPMRIASINVKRKPDISFLHVFGALCYPKNDCEHIGKLRAKGDIGFFIGYSADSCAYRVYNQRTKKIIETMNVTFDELSAMAFEQSSSKPGLQSMTYGQISSGLDLTYAPSTITNQQPTKRELDLLFEAMHDYYIGGQPSAAPRTGLAAQAP